MKNKKTTLIISLLFVLLIGGAAVLYAYLGDNFKPQGQLTPDAPSQSQSGSGDTSGTGAQQALQKMPDFTVYDRNGSPVKLSDYFGKPIVLNFWASSCGPCRMEMADFHKAYKELGEEIQFLMVNMTDGVWDTMDSATAFIKKEGFTFPVLFDTEENAAYTYGIRSLPTTFFINAKGEGVAHAAGAIDREILLKGIDMIRQ